MNDIQRISRQIRCERLKLQMGLPPETDLDLPALQAMDHRLRRERLLGGRVFRYSGGLKLQVVDDS